MKNYREIRRLQPEEWEKDDNWKGLRLSFLWNIRHYYPDIWRNTDLSYEKEDFYYFNDSNVDKIAINDHYSVDRDYYDRIFKDKSLDDKVSKFRKLEKLRITNIQEFLKKKNCNMYEYFDIIGLSRYLGDSELEE